MCCVSLVHKKLSPTEFKHQISLIAKVQIVDVRTVEEYDSGHLKGAINYNYYDPGFNSLISNLDTEIPVFVYCQLGGRSEEACSLFKDAGFENVYDLKGGIIAWKK